MFCVLLAPAVFAQDAVPEEILNRTFNIKIGNNLGTAFKIDHHSKVYLVTARHMTAGLPTGETTIQVRHGDVWMDYRIVNTIFPSSNDVDIAVFETTEKVSQPFEVAVATDGEGVTLGQPVWFLGYAFTEGLRSRFRNAEYPFIKKGLASAIDTTNPEAILLYIDGFNNHGFSGGPIVYWDFKSHAYRICGVVKGYRDDTAKIKVNGVEVDTNLLVNSGILVGYDIVHAVRAIEQAERPQ
jgi:hypothetical protein